MGPKKGTGFDQAIAELESQVKDYLGQGITLSTTPAASRSLYEHELVMEIPELYLFYRKWRVMGSLPLVQGGWYDQPYITCLAIETCEKAEREFWEDLKADELRRTKTEERGQPTRQDFRDKPNGVPVVDTWTLSESG